MEQKQPGEQRDKTLKKWENATGLTLKAVPPTNKQRWVIEANTINAQQIKSLLDSVQKDNRVKYIEEDRIMTIMPVQRIQPMQPILKTH